MRANIFIQSKLSQDTRIVYVKGLLGENTKTYCHQVAAHVPNVPYVINFQKMIANTAVFDI